MPKDIRLESFKYHFFREIEDQRLFKYSDTSELLQTLELQRVPKGILCKWSKPQPGFLEFLFADYRFYRKGDSERAVQVQIDANMLFSDDIVQAENKTQITLAVQELLKEANIKMPSDKIKRLETEESFHDDWAAGEHLHAIDVRLVNEALTAPELRYIHKSIGNIEGKSVLDVGCGLGEASVYFAMRGARVTSTDLSGGMLQATIKLAELNGVDLSVHKCSAEGLGFPEGTEFDIIYSGNLLHHVEIEKTLIEMKKFLKPGGVLVTWDPLHYNPVINSYRKKATEVRTPDEHPLTWSDLKLFDKHYLNVKRKYFWLTSLSIFIIMALIQRRDPNKERYWKSVIKESGKWAPIYRPLALIDAVLLKILPPLRLLCWNVVVISQK